MIQDEQGFAQYDGFGQRGTGRTTKLLAATPPGGVFVTHAPAMRDYIKHYLKVEGRHQDEIEVKTVRQAVNFLRGRRVPVTIDHVVMDTFGCIDRSERDELLMHCRTIAPYIVMLNAEGNITTWWNRSQSR